MAVSSFKLFVSGGTLQVCCRAIAATSTCSDEEQVVDSLRCTCESRLSQASEDYLRPKAEGLSEVAQEAKSSCAELAM